MANDRHQTAPFRFSEQFESRATTTTINTHAYILFQHLGCQDDEQGLEFLAQQRYREGSTELIPRPFSNQVAKPYT